MYYYVFQLVEQLVPVVSDPPPCGKSGFGPICIVFDIYDCQDIHHRHVIRIVICSDR